MNLHRYTAVVEVKGRPMVVSYYADIIVPDGHTLWFMREHHVVGSLLDEDVHALFRDDDRLIDAPARIQRAAAKNTSGSVPDPIRT